MKEGSSNARSSHSASRRHPHLSRGKRLTFLLVAVLLSAILGEGLSAVALRLSEGVWPYTRPRTANYLLFEPHPEWVITPRKNVSVTAVGVSHSHNNEGFRGPPFATIKTKPRVACLGGSTVYGIGIGDNETWPFLLNQLLQPDIEVINFGIPGHSSVEHKKLLPYVLDRYSPDLVLIQTGLNDLHNMHVDDLGVDYENFHQPALRFSASGACRRDKLPPLALAHGSVIVLEKLGILDNAPFPQGLPPGTVSDAADPRVLETFTTNLEIMLDECRTNGVPVVLLPQTMSVETIDETNYKWWAPYLTKQGIFNALGAFNDVLRSKADIEGVVYANFLEEESWSASEFCDPSHLNGAGNARLARLLQQGVPWTRLLSEPTEEPRKDTKEPE